MYTIQKAFSYNNKFQFTDQNNGEHPWFVQPFIFEPWKFQFEWISGINYHFCVDPWSCFISTQKSQDLLESQKKVNRHGR